ncbi:TetR/AcrR family transcriptional regulator [Promicromonospora sp. NPDC090134]|uniref:TetR/AcrR family transcriptional regulator n=1 Tax=Promicromonospora sp. NPDC090134 TaxID=3364408 RepID=UPI003801A70B
MASIEQTVPAREALLRAAREELVEKGHAAVSLRAVARRAGVSHAAPAHFFGDRAGMLTAVATDGFGMLERALEDAARKASGGGETTLAALGLAYVDFGLAHPALVDLMFRRSELVPDDPSLVAAQRAALGRLRGAVGDVVGERAEEWSLVSWAVVHGLVNIVREGLLARIAGYEPDREADHARELVALYATAFGRQLGAGGGEGLRGQATASFPELGRS